MPKRWRIRKLTDEGIGGTKTVVAVIELADDELPPEGAEPVADDVPLHGWRIVEERHDGTDH